MSDLDEVLAGIGRSIGSDGAELDIEADVRIDITPVAGAASSARLTGRGQHLRFETERLGALLTGVDRSTAGRIADLLAATGVTVDVVGPAGRLATVGSGTSSRLGKLISGSPHIAPRPWSALRHGASTPGARAALVIVLAAVVSVVCRHMTEDGS